VFSHTVTKYGGSTRSGSTLPEIALYVAVWRKARPPFVTLLEFASRVAMWRKSHPTFVTLQEYA